MRKEGKFIGVDGTIPEGQGIVMAHLNECHELLEMVCTTTSSSGSTVDAAVGSQLKQSMDEHEDYTDDTGDPDTTTASDEE